MSCRAILHSTGKESIPLLLVRSGELTPRQCDHEFKGEKGECPTCKAMIDRADLGDGSSFASAMLQLRERGQTVTYKRFGYGSDGGVEPWRVCYWGHPPGYWDGVQFRDCQSASTSAHTVHLAVIQQHYEKQFKPEDGFTIKTEQRLRKPGDPPRPYSPDLAIYGPKGERMVAVEYQRSHEAYEKFCDRDDLRRSEKWAAVDWWFDDTQPDPEKERTTVYGRSQMHRTHLALMSVPFFRCWVDPATLVLEADEGMCGELPPNRHKRVERKLEKAELAECSTAKIMRQIEDGPERSIIEGYTAPLEAKAGSELNFRARVEYSLEKERRLALAVVERQKRLEEQDRRHREWVAEQQRIEAERRERERIRQEELERQRQKEEQERRRAEERLRKIEFIKNHGHDPEDLQTASDAYLEELEDACLKADAIKLAEEQAKAEQEAVERKAREEAAEAEWRAERERIAAERQAQWERDNAELVERQRKEAEAERHWHPTKLSAPFRGGQRMVLNLLAGEKIRPHRQGEIETFVERTGAGYSTNRYTHRDLDGWQVWKEKPIDS